MTGETTSENPLLTQFKFIPFDEQFQLKVASRLGKIKPAHYLYSNNQPEIYLQNRYPLALRDAEGDGACLPRCISLAIYGTEKYHQMLRDRVVDFIIANHLPCEPEVRGNNFMSEMATMRRRKTKMTTREVEGFAFLLDCPIYTCCQVETRHETIYAWQRLPHEKSRVQVSGTRGIYILNADVHFQIVKKP